MDCTYACRSMEHAIARRRFLGGVAGMGLAAFVRPAAAAQLASAQKRMLVVFLHGGVSQLETWDPKPGTATGGPFRAIPTSVTGTHISELLPHTARQMHRLSIVRSVNTKEDDHGKGWYLMHTGRRRDDPTDYPHLGAVAAKAIHPAESPLPGHIHITAGGGARNDNAAYLGPRYAAVMLDNGQAPQNSERPGAISDAADAQRHAFRRAADARFTSQRRTASTDAYTHSYEQALRLMEQRQVFDVSKESEADRQRYGTHDFGRQCLLGRRLLESGVTFVQINHTNYDSHHEHFDAHMEQLGEFDRPFATLVDDLAQRGMLESTLVLVLSEFGRTPTINHLYGRDHYSAAWSIVMGGCGIVPGAVHGRTNDRGTEVVEGQVDQANLFHTYLRAVGLDSTASFDIQGRAMPMADPASYPIKELLA